MADDHTMHSSSTEQEFDLARYAWVWSAVFVLVTLGLAVVPALGWAWAQSSADVWRAQVALLGALVFLTVWFVWGRETMAETGTATTRRRYLVTGMLTLALATLGNPQMATLQTVFYPTVWASALSLRNGMRWNTATAITVTAGLVGNALWRGGSAPEALSALAIGAASWAFSTAMGVWITRAFEHAHEREQLLTRLHEQEVALGSERAAAAAQRERERMAADLHDTVTQSIAGIVMLGQRGQRETDPQQAQQLFTLITSSAEQALTEARSLVAVASTAGVAQAQSLAEALHQVCTRFERETGITVRTVLPETAEALGRLDQPRRTLTIRIVQEGLANVRKHAAAREVEVSAHPDGDHLVVRVRDDGHGMPPEFDIATSRGFGLPGLRDRLAQHGGTLTLAQAAPHGTTLEARL